MDVCIYASIRIDSHRRRKGKAEAKLGGFYRGQVGPVKRRWEVGERWEKNEAEAETLETRTEMIIWYGLLSPLPTPLHCIYIKLKIEMRCCWTN